MVRLFEHVCRILVPILSPISQRCILAHGDADNMQGECREKAHKSRLSDGFLSKSFAITVNCGNAKFDSPVGRIVDAQMGSRRLGFGSSH